MDNSSSNIGLLGGTYDPVHKGHVAIAKSFVTSSFIDQLWILLTPSPPHKKERTFAAYHHRLAMLKSAFNQYEHICVSTIEKQIEPPQYSYKTVHHLLEKHPDVTFYICIGEDGYVSFDSWYKFENILERCELLVARRPGFRTDQQEHPLIRNKAHFVEHEPVDVSSTDIRDKIKTGQKITGLVPGKVAHYIRNNQLYKR